jgi:transposase InsO family protein
MDERARSLAYFLVPAYGYRRITRELGRRGFEANDKRVLRLMRADNLLCLRRKAFVGTTDSRHNLPVYPNLARDIAPDGVNQLWRADITYIRLRAEFVYLAVVLDAYSRRVVGWALGRTLEAELAVSALAMALRQPRPAPGLCIIPTAACSMPRSATTSPCNDLPANGDNPLNFVSHSRGSVQRGAAARFRSHYLSDGQVANYSGAGSGSVGESP